MSVAGPICLRIASSVELATMRLAKRIMGKMIPRDPKQKPVSHDKNQRDYLEIEKKNEPSVQSNPNIFQFHFSLINNQRVLTMPMTYSQTKDSNH